ncbi:MAG: hypothetical protein Q9195_007186 [Heterodermia aff. obscurata]
MGDTRASSYPYVGDTVDESFPAHSYAPQPELPSSYSSHAGKQQINSTAQSSHHYFPSERMTDDRLQQDGQIQSSSRNMPARHPIEGRILQEEKHSHPSSDKELAFAHDPTSEKELAYAHDPIDVELLQEAQDKHISSEKEPASAHGPSSEKMLASDHGPSSEKILASENDQDQLLDQHFSWIPPNPPQPYQTGHLARPILIPQDIPGIQQSFSRAWAPDLANHHVRPEEFLQFIDHLNVCKAASPPFQVLNLAGTVLGFTPIPAAGLVGLGVSALSVGGNIATARVRIARYLARANKDYFEPRGLHARIAKQNVIPEITRQPANAPMLANFEGVDPGNAPPLRERRLMALGDSIARLEFVGLGAPKKEGNMLDKLSAKMLAHKTERKQHKSDKDVHKERKKIQEEMEKLDEEARKAEREANKKMRKNPEKADRKYREEMTKIDEKRREEQDKYREKVSDGGKDEDKSARKFLWIVVQDLQDVRDSEGTVQGL